MVVFAMFWRTLHSAVALLYPTYASYKALCKRPADEQELERWLMYWSVMGVIVTLEYTAEWLVSWIPLYQLLKTIVLAYLALPSGQGAANLYTTHLYPLLRQHESQIDELFGSLRGRAWEVIQAKLRDVLAMVGIAWDTAPTGQGAQNPNQPPPPPQGGVAGLWAAYGPTLVAGAGTFLRNAQASAAGASASMNTPRDPAGGDGYQQPIAPGVRAASSNSMFARDEGATAMRRRRELETELNSLPPPPSGFGPGPGHPSSLVPGGASGISSRSTSSSSFGRISGSGFLAPSGGPPSFPIAQPHPPPSPARSTHSASSSGGETTRFEELGYDMSGDESVSSAGLSSPRPRRSEGSRPDPTRRQSWWSWAAGGGTQQGYEALHNKDD